MISLLAVAMAFLETSVVVYLRALYYPHGFEFPVIAMSPLLSVTELLREFATMIMLVSMGYLAGRNGWQRFAWFLYSFAVWDIFYYVFLKLLLNWPASWFTFDLLFLLPLIWTGPVLAPLLVSLTMILMAFAIFYADRVRGQLIIRWPERMLVLAGALMIFFSFIQDFSVFFFNRYSLRQLFNSEDSAAILNAYIPATYNWILMA